MRHIGSTGVNDELSRREWRSMADTYYTDLWFCVPMQKPINSFALWSVTGAGHAWHLSKRKHTAITLGTRLWRLPCLFGYRAGPFLGLHYHCIFLTFICMGCNVVNRRFNRFGLVRIYPKFTTSTWTWGISHVITATEVYSCKYHNSRDSLIHLTHSNICLFYY